MSNEAMVLDNDVVRMAASHVILEKVREMNPSPDLFHKKTPDLDRLIAGAMEYAYHRGKQDADSDLEAYAFDRKVGHKSLLEVWTVAMKEGNR